MSFELIISPLYNFFGVLEGRVIVAYDITGHKKLEADLKNTNEAIHDALTGVYNRRFLWAWRVFSYMA